MEEKNYFFFVCKEFLIAEFHACAESERSFDISLYDLANYKQLLDLLGLHYIQGGPGSDPKYWTKERRGDWFAGYLSQFCQNLKKEGFFQYCKTNPTVRILITDEEMLKKIKITK